MEKAQTKLEGKFDWKTPQVIRASFFEGDDAVAIHEEILQRYGDNLLVTGNIGYNQSNSKLITGSKPGYAVAVNEIFRANSLPMRTATPSDLGRIVESGILNQLRGTYEDAALVLRSEAEPNSYLAQRLAEQVRARGFSFSAESPLMIPLNGLSLVKDSNSPYGLAFSLIEGAELIEAPQLVQDCQFSKTDEKGRPIADKKGDRYSVTRSSGVSRLFQVGGLNLYSSWDNLHNSNADGRVVVVSEADARNFLAQREAELRKQYEAQKSELDFKSTRALEFLEAGYKKALETLRR